MNARFEKILPIALVLGAVSLYLVKYFAGIPVLYYPLLVIIALFCAAAARQAAAARPGLAHLIHPEPISDRAAMTVLAAIAAVFFIVFTAMAACKYNAFSLRMFDFGLMDQAIWNMAHGRLLEVTNVEFPYENISRMSTHVEAIYCAIAPLYRIVSDPRALFAVQSLFVCGAIVLVFVIARIVLADNAKALAIAGAAALYPALQFMDLFDFHGDVLSIPFFLLSYFGYLTKKEWVFWTGLAGALFCKEYAGFAAVGYGWALMASHRDWKRGTVVSVLGAAYFLTAFYAVVPLFNNGSESLITSQNYKAVGGESGLAGMVVFACSHPWALVAEMKTMQNAESLFYLFFPLAFLPLLSPGFLLGAVPIFLKDMLSGMDIGNHRLACALPFIFISFIYGMQRIENFMEDQRRKRLLAACGFPLLLVCVMSVMASFFYGPSPLGHRFWRERAMYAVSGHARACEAVIKNIPAEARISVSDNLSSHLTHRQFCYIFPAPLKRPDSLQRSVDYLCVDTTFRQSLVWGDSSFTDQTLPLIRSIGVDSIMERDGVYLFKKRSVKKQYF